MTPFATTTIALSPAACCPSCGQEACGQSLDRDAVRATSTLLDALADPVRLGIVTLLSKHDRMCVCDIVDAFSIGQPTVSHHLRILRAAGIVDCERRAQWAYYWLRRDVMKHVAGEIVNLL